MEMITLIPEDSTLTDWLNLRFFSQCKNNVRKVYMSALLKRRQTLYTGGTVLVSSYLGVCPMTSNDVQ